jgi:hypothetical protein
LSFFIIPYTVTLKRWRTRSPKAHAKPCATVDIKRVPERAPPEVAKPAHYKIDQAASVAKIEDFANYDAIVVGTGTRFGRMSSQMANFLDQAGRPVGQGRVARQGRLASDRFFRRLPPSAIPFSLRTFHAAVSSPGGFLNRRCVDARRGLSCAPYRLDLRSQSVGSCELAASCLCKRSRAYPLRLSS